MQAGNRELIISPAPIRPHALSPGQEVLDLSPLLF